MTTYKSDDKTEFTVRRIDPQVLEEITRTLTLTLTLNLALALTLTLTRCSTTSAARRAR